MRKPFAAFAGWVVAAVLSPASPAGAQVIYEPVRYQYGANPTYYYGGSDPLIIENAERVSCVHRISDAEYGTDRYNDAYLHPRLIGQLERVYSDCTGFVNARVYGYDKVDARNAAYRNLPRYFRKADLLRAADVLPDGTRVVPAQLRPLPPAGRRDAGRAARPATQPKPILIIPKAPKAAPGAPSDKQVASAR